jgi:large subunit ribosomal protein L5
MSTTTNTPRLADKYKQEVVPALMKKFSYKTVMQAPRLTKICLNRGVNGAVTDKKLIDIAVDELSNITGQKAVATMSKKDISNFKLRKNMPIGARVTLRGVKIKATFKALGTGIILNTPITLNQMPVRHLPYPLRKR